MTAPQRGTRGRFTKAADYVTDLATGQTSVIEEPAAEAQRTEAEFIAWLALKHGTEWSDQNRLLAEGRRIAQAIADRRAELRREFERDPSPLAPPRRPINTTALPLADPAGWNDETGPFGDDPRF